MAVRHDIVTADAPASGILALDMAEREGSLSCLSPRMEEVWNAPVYCPCVRNSRDWFPSSVPTIEKGVLMIDHVRHILDAHGIGHASVAAANELQSPENARVLIAEAGKRDIELVPVNLSIAGACAAGIRDEGRDLVIDQRYDGTIAAEVAWKDRRPVIAGAHLTDYGWKKPFEAVKSMMDLAAMICGCGRSAFDDISAGIRDSMQDILDGTADSITTRDGSVFAVDRGSFEGTFDPDGAKLIRGNMGAGARIDRRYFGTADRIVITGTAGTQEHLRRIVLDAVPSAEDKVVTLQPRSVLAGAARFMMMRKGAGA